MAEKAHSQEHAPSDSPEVLHEQTDVSPWGIVAFGAALVVGAIIVHLVIWGLFVYFGSLNAGVSPREYPLAPTGVLRLPPAPRLQVKPREELKALRRQEDQVLREYGWADQNAGTARIPIDEAMRRVLHQGLPAAPSAPGAARAPAAPSTSNSGRTTEEGSQP
jgi:hypothetical protein